MQLFLLRHGNAESFAPRDRDRQLSAEGREELHQVLSSCQALLTNVDCVLVSPYLRAQQSCAIARQYLPHISDQQEFTADFLIPGGSSQAVIDWAFASAVRAPLLVSHQPLIGTLLDELCGFEPGRYRLGTAALAAVNADIVARGLGELQWLKQPEPRQ